MNFNESTDSSAYIWPRGGKAKQYLDEQKSNSKGKSNSSNSSTRRIDLENITRDQIKEDYTNIAVIKVRDEDKVQSIN